MVSNGSELWWEGEDASVKSLETLAGGRGRHSHVNVSFGGGERTPLSSRDKLWREGQAQFRAIVVGFYMWRGFLTRYWVGIMFLAFTNPPRCTKHTGNTLSDLQETFSVNNNLNKIYHIVLYILSRSYVFTYYYMIKIESIFHYLFCSYDFR